MDRTMASKMAVDVLTSKCDFADFDGQSVDFLAAFGAAVVDDGVDCIVRCSMQCLCARRALELPEKEIGIGSCGFCNTHEQSL
jgi:hypothetical protein